MKYLIILFVLFSQYANAQTYKLYGTVREENSNEPVLYAHIYPETKNNYAISDEYGYFSLTLESGKHNIIVSHAAYQSDTIAIDLQSDKLVNLYLKNRTIETVEVKASIPALQQTISGLTTIDSKRIEYIPSFAGEADVIKAIAYLPGIIANQKGFSSISVRGGDKFNNLFLIDDAPVYGTTHGFGFISAFNADIIKQMNVYKGGFPARFGGRTSSIIDIRTKQGNNKNMQGSVNVGVLKSKLLLEGPIIKDKMSFILAGRSLYINQLTSLVERSFEDMQQMPKYNFSDINGKISYQLNPKHLLFVSIFHGGDYLWVKDGEKTPVYYNLNNRNISGVLGHKWILNSKWVLHSSLTHTLYNNSFETEKQTDPEITDSLVTFEYWNSQIKDFALNLKAEYYASEHHKLKFGSKSAQYNVSPFDFNTMNSDGNDSTTNLQTSNEITVFVEDEFNITSKIYFNAGLRYTLFGSNDFWYTKPEPRLAVNWHINPALSAKLSYSVTNQYLNIIEKNVAMGTGTEIWVTSDKDFKPQDSKQLSAGLFGELEEHNTSFSVEAYYKKMRELLYYQYSVNTNEIQENITDVVHKHGKGNSYGVEFFIDKENKNFYTSLSYTLAWSNRQFDGINSGNYFPSNYDSRHQINFLYQYYPDKKNELGMHWVFNSAIPVTLPEAYVQTNQYYWGYYIFNGINNDRLSPYHRLDIYWKRNSRGIFGLKRYWSFNVYNAYVSLSPVYVYPSGGKLKKISLFPFLLTVNWGISF